MRAYIFVLCCLSVHLACAVAYKGGVINSSNNEDVTRLVYEAGQKNVDVLVLTSADTNYEDSYDETVKDLSKAARQAGLYLVAHLIEKTVCQKKQEIVRSNLVFDRQGAIVSVYRKPTTDIANCTIPSPGLATFTADFGVTFGVMMEEDLVLKSLEELKGLKDFVVTGAWSSEILFLSASQFTSTWAYTVEANVLSSYGIFAGKAGVRNGSGRLLIADLKTSADEETVFNPPVVNPASIQNYPGEDLSQYIIRPLNVEASSQGYKESVCHNSFCCEFDLKTSFRGSKQEVSYGLAAFNGVRHYGGGRYLGTRSCAVVACTAVYKRSCGFGSANNNTNIAFEKLTISANFTSQNSIQYPIILSNEVMSVDKFTFVTKTDKNAKQVTIALTDSENLLTFGIFGRDFENDYQKSFENVDEGRGIYDYIFTEDLQEFFDYVWIRLRVLIFIVSIYVLEMM